MRVVGSLILVSLLIGCIDPDRVENGLARQIGHVDRASDDRPLERQPGPPQEDGHESQGVYRPKDNNSPHSSKLTRLGGSRRTGGLGDMGDWGM